MRLILLILISPWLGAGALAEPISLNGARAMLGKYDARDMRVAILNGYPVITGSFEEQGFTATMLECDGNYVCNAVVLRACRPLVSFDRAAGLELVNGYNNDLQSRGAAYLESESGIADRACISDRVDLDTETVFGMGAVFRWKRTMVRFTDFLAEQSAERQSRAILGGER